MTNILDSRRNAARVAIVLPGLGIALSTIGVVFSLVERQLLQSAAAGQSISMEEAEASDSRQQTISMIQIGVTLLSYITLLIWINQTNKSLRHIGVEGMNFTPGWAVGWFFIPFANLFRPYQVVQELWQASDPDTPFDDPTAWLLSSTSAVVGFWWAGEVISNVVGRVHFQLSRHAETLPEFISSNMFGMVLDLLNIVVVILALNIILPIEKRLRRKAEALPIAVDLSEDQSFGGAVA